jgi:hypothetical protein
MEKAVYLLEKSKAKNEYTTVKTAHISDLDLDATAKKLGKLLPGHEKVDVDYVKTFFNT